MFAEGDWIVYSSTGVCQVSAVGRLQGIPAADREKVYYTLEPYRSREIIYIPVDSSVFMRPVISRDLKRLRDYYGNFLKTHTCEDLVRLIRSVREKSRKLEARGGHPRKIDQDYQKRAEELLYTELSTALHQPYDLVARQVERQIGNT